MRKFLFVMALLLVTSPCFAERWIKCIDTTIGTVNFEKPQRIEGDCLVLGLCTGANNTGLATNVFEAVGSEWNDAAQENKKCDRLAPAGSRIINLTAQQIIDVTNALASQHDSYIRTGAKAKYEGQTQDGQALRCFAKAVVDENNLHVAKVTSIMDCVDNASTLATLKSCVAALPNLNTRTYANAVTAVKACIDGGAADE